VNTKIKNLLIFWTREFYNFICLQKIRQLISSSIHSHFQRVPVTERPEKKSPTINFNNATPLGAVCALSHIYNNSAAEAASSEAAAIKLINLLRDISGTEQSCGTAQTSFLLLLVLSLAFAQLN